MKLVRHLTLFAALLGPAAADDTCLPDGSEGPLLAPGAAAGDELGAGVALSSGGDLALVGAPGRSDLGVESGAAYAFRRAGGGWALEAVLLAGAGAGGQRFGSAVALAAAGDRALVGAPDDGPGGGGVGAVHVFEDSGGVWTEVAVVPGGADARRFGASVALDGSGDTALVGAPGSFYLAGFTGLAYVYGRAGRNWTLEGTIYDSIPLAALTAPYECGASVSLSADGNTALVGIPRHDQFGPWWEGGMVSWVRTGTTWTPEAFARGLVAACEMTDFGRAVAISDDGARALVGAPVYTFDLPQCPPSGSARELVRIGVDWQVTSLILPDDGDEDDAFGRAVAWSANASVALVGAPGDDDAGPDAGAVYLFQGDGTAWTQAGKLTLAGTSAGGAAGTAVALSASGSTALAGAPAAEGAAAGSGSAEPFAGLSPSTYCTAKVASAGCLPAVDSAGSPSLSSGAPFLVTARDVVNQKSGLFFYGTNGRAALPFLGGTLCAQPPLQRTPVQGSGGSAPPAADCTGSFVFDLNAWAASGVDPDLAVGVQVNGQFWYRDPAHPDGTGVGLTDAVELAFCD